MSSGARSSNTPSPQPSPGVPGEGAKRILLLITDLEIGGTPTVVRELAIRLHDSAHIEVACLSRWGPVADQLRDAGIHVTAFNATRPIDLPSVVLHLIQLIQKKHLDTVFSFLIHANTIAAIASRFCRGVRFLQSIQTTQPTPRWHWCLQSIVQFAAEQIIVPSPSTADAAAQWARVPAEKIRVIPNAVDSHLRGMRATDLSESIRIGFIGRLDPIKRVTDLLLAVRMLDKRFTLHVYGDGADRGKIEANISRLELQNRVTLHGTIAHPQDALGLIDVLVLPSAAEGFGLVLIEAMAAGVPVVATDVPGIRDVVTNGQTGLLVPVASPGDLAAAIRQVCDDASLRARLIQRASDDVRQRFSWDVILPQYKQLLT